MIQVQVEQSKMFSSDSKKRIENKRQLESFAIDGSSLWVESRTLYILYTPYMTLLKIFAYASDTHHIQIFEA